MRVGPRKATSTLHRIKNSKRKLPESNSNYKSSQEWFCKEKDKAGKEYSHNLFKKEAFEINKNGRKKAGFIFTKFIDGKAITIKSTNINNNSTDEDNIFIVDKKIVVEIKYDNDNTHINDDKIIIELTGPYTGNLSDPLNESVKIKVKINNQIAIILNDCVLKNFQLKSANLENPKQSTTFIIKNDRLFDENGLFANVEWQIILRNDGLTYRLSTSRLSNNIPIKEKLMLFNDYCKDNLKHILQLILITENISSVENKLAILENALKSKNALKNSTYAANILYLLYSISAFNKIEESKQLFYLKSAAEKGNPGAQFNLGMAYLHENLGLEKNNNMAIEWLREAANQGLPDAQYNLGYFHYYGIGIKENLQEAIKWHKKSADLGYAPAQHALGYYYEQGEGLDRNYKKTFSLYQMSAEQGYTPAQNNLAHCYLYGIGTEKDEVKAFKLFTQAAAEGNPYAQYNLSVCYRNGIEGIKPDMAAAIEWLKKAASNGDPIAQNELNNINVNNKKSPQLNQDAVDQNP